MPVPTRFPLPVDDDPADGKCVSPRVGKGAVSVNKT